MANKLTDIKIKADYALLAVSRARDEVNFPGPLWYHAIGFLNAFYALEEELKNNVQNANDDKLKAAVKSWREANKKNVNEFFGPARNMATHQGKITTEGYLVLEDDPLNDTQDQIRRATVTVDGSKIEQMPAEDFLDLCERAMTFMRDGIVNIDENYKSLGGGGHELPPKTTLDDIF